MAARSNRSSGPSGQVHDVLVVGGGPAGSSCAYWLAEAGWDVVVVEKKVFPREKTCGDGLTPRAVRQIADMGLEDALSGAHRFDGLRAFGFGQSVEMAWPDHPTFPSYGYTITRHDLDGLVADRAVRAGATIRQGTEAISPLTEAGSPTADSPDGIENVGKGGETLLPICHGALVRGKDGATEEIRAKYVVVADGSLSRFGRSLGTSRARAFPLGMALRAYYQSPRHDEGFIESHLDIRDPNGQAVPGYGWIFPLGDGRVNVGVGLLSTDRRWRGVNTSQLMDTFVQWAPKSWELSAATACGPATGGKLPMGMSVTPRVGPNTIIIGDASGVINPFNGEGIAYGYETGRLAATVLADALSGAGSEAVLGYADLVDAAYRDYYRVARAFVKLISRPQIMRLCVGTGLRSEFVMSELLRIMANLMRPGSAAPAELGFRAMDVAARLVAELPLR